MLAARPLLWTRPHLYWRLEGVLFSWLLNMVGMLSYAAKYEIVEMGDRVDHLLERRCLLVANHQSTGDVPLLMNAFTAPSYGEAANHAMWIMDSMFRWTNFGLVSQLHRDFFIECGRAKRDKSVEELRHALYTHYLYPGRRWLLLFPEGGFLHKRQEASRRFAEKNGLPNLKHVTLPRIGAAQAILHSLAPSINNHTGSTCAPSIIAEPKPKQNCSATVANGSVSVESVAARAGDISASSARTVNISASSPRANGVVSSQLEYLIDLTIAYPDQKRPLNLWSIMSASRKPCRIIFYYRVYPISQVPRDKDGLTEWFYQLFYDKERMLSAYYGNSSTVATSGGENGTIPASTPASCGAATCGDRLTDGKCPTDNCGNGRVEMVDGRGNRTGKRGDGDCGRGLFMSGRGRVIRHDPLAWLLRHCFFIVCTYAMLCIFYYIYSSFCQIFDCIF